MEQQAWSESGKVEISILAEIIVTPMVSKAPNVQKIFHQIRNKPILDVQVIQNCPNVSFSNVMYYNIKVLLWVFAGNSPN